MYTVSPVVSYNIGCVSGDSEGDIRLFIVVLRLGLGALTSAIQVLSLWVLAWFYEAGYYE